MKRILFDELAKLELEDSAEFYEIQVAGLGKRFREEVKVGLRRVKENPGTWPKEKGDIKRYLLYKFPYKILYSIEKE